MNECGGCGCQEGSLHKPGCTAELCPFCGGQLISCSCIYEKFYPGFDRSKPMCGLPAGVYENGPPPNIVREWDYVLEAKGRIPYIHWPIRCARCGVEYPKMFRVPDTQWEKYIQPGERRQVVCKSCWNEIVALVDGAAELEGSNE